jgi:hypothetical protein
MCKEECWKVTYEAHKRPRERLHEYVQDKKALIYEDSGLQAC